MRTIFISILCLLFTFLPHFALAAETGEQAPAFSGNSTQGMIKLADFLGKQNVVLALYFRAFTPV